MRVVIIGGGPAGSALGCYLGRAGLDVRLFEAARHPRPHVGESLVTSTTRVLGELGFLDTMEREGFVRKYGAAWHPPEQAAAFSIEFSEFPQEGIDQDYTYHVDRGVFDHLLLRHAEKHGVAVEEEARVLEVLFDDGRARGVRVVSDGVEREVEADVVVDASGRATLLGNQLRMKHKDPIFDQYAVHTWVEDLDRGEGAQAEYIHIYFLPVERGWVWQIPITDRVTSVGVVTERRVFQAAAAEPEAWFDRHVRSTPDLATAMRRARTVRPFAIDADYSYSVERLVGDGWLLVGDAGRFVDPIFSAGVSVALDSARFASERLLECAAAGDFSAAALEPYAQRLRGGIEVWYEFIRLYYKLLPAFTYFVKSPRHRLDVLRLLQGEVYDRDEVPVLDHMREFIAKVEASDGMPMWKRSLTDVPLDDGTSADAD